MTSRSAPCLPSLTRHPFMVSCLEVRTLVIASIWLQGAFIGTLWSCVQACSRFVDGPAYQGNLDLTCNGAADDEQVSGNSL